MRKRKHFSSLARNGKGMSSNRSFMTKLSQAFQYLSPAFTARRVGQWIWKRELIKALRYSKGQVQRFKEYAQAHPEVRKWLIIALLIEKIVIAGAVGYSMIKSDTQANDSKPSQVIVAEVKHFAPKKTAEVVKFQTKKISTPAVEKIEPVLSVSVPKAKVMVKHLIIDAPTPAKTVAAVSMPPKAEIAPEAKFEGCQLMLKKGMSDEVQWRIVEWQKEAIRRGLGCQIALEGVAHISHENGTWKLRRLSYDSCAIGLTQEHLRARYKKPCWIAVRLSAPERFSAEQVAEAEHADCGPSVGQCKNLVDFDWQKINYWNYFEENMKLFDGKMEYVIASHLYGRGGVRQFSPAQLRRGVDKFKYMIKHEQAKAQFFPAA